MRNILALPSSLLIILLTPPTTSTTPSKDSDPLISSNQWFHDLPAHIKYWPNDLPHARRDLEFLQKTVKKRMDEGEIPNVVKKMSGDEGEMFFPEYWGFGDLGIGAQSFLGSRDLEEAVAGNEENLLRANGSTLADVKPAFALHFQDSSSRDLAVLPRNIDSLKHESSIPNIFARGSCPGGTSSCDSIGYPNSCCSSGETCIKITDTGLGPVGCCAAGGNCQGQITTCSQGQTACGSALGGGCCIAGFECAGVGCVETIIVTITSIYTITASSTTSILTSTITTAPATPTATDLQSTLSCAPSARPCPINLGGGCCNSDRICTTGLLCPLSPGLSSTSITTIITTSTSTSTATGTEVPNAPVRPTSSDEVTQQTTTTAPLTPGTCPTGFYQCSAYYNAGSCCRVGRDCKTTDCPATASTTLVSNGVTLVVPLNGAATTFATDAGGSCASAWSTCTAGTTSGGVQTGGGCCPSGFACGGGSCTSVSPTQTSVTGKEAAGNGGLRAGVDMGAVVGVVLLWAVMTVVMAG